MTDSKPTLVHLTASLEMGGTERQLLLTLPRLKKFRHVVICLQNWGKVGDQLKDLGIETHFLKPRHFFDRKVIREYRALLKEVSPKTIVTYLPFADFWGRVWTPKRVGVKLVCFLRSTMKEWRYFPFVLANIATHFMVDCYLAVSQETRDFYARFGLPKKKTTVVYNGLDLTPFAHVVPTIKSTGGTFLLGYVARLRKERGHRLLFKAMKDMVAQQPQLKLLLVGDGPYREPLERCVERYGLSSHVEFLGFRKDIPEVLASLDLYVHPSLYEGMSNALLEALAAGCAIVTTDIPENRELVEHEKTGLLVKPKNASALAQAIASLFHNEPQRTKLSAAAQQRAQNFDIEKTTSQLKSFLSSTLHDH